MRRCFTASAVTYRWRESHCGLFNVNGTLYGTTKFGGEISSDGLRNGVQRSARPAPSKCCTSFAPGSDGYYPAASLINVNGTLYGTTWSALTEGDRLQHHDERLLDEPP